MAGSFSVNGKEYNLPTSLTVGEMCDAEGYFGVEFGTEKQGLRMASALMWIAVRRVDPTVTVEDIRALPAEVFASVVDADASPPALGTSENDGSSGEASEPISANTNGQKTTGSPGSDIGSDSDPLTLAS